jgi:hypothetical protein
MLGHHPALHNGRWTISTDKAFSADIMPLHAYKSKAETQHTFPIQLNDLTLSASTEGGARIFPHGWVRHVRGHRGVVERELDRSLVTSLEYRLYSRSLDISSYSIHRVGIDAGAGADRSIEL